MNKFDQDMQEFELKIFMAVAEMDAFIKYEVLPRGTGKNIKLAERLKRHFMEIALLTHSLRDLMVEPELQRANEAAASAMLIGETIGRA